MVCFECAAQNAACQARVIDSDTGEPIPCVGIYVSAGRTTLTNYEGEFSIKAGPTDTLRLTCIGYETIFLKTDSVPKTIRMQPMDRYMTEVSVIAPERLLVNLVRQMSWRFGQARRQRTRYFYRQTTLLAGKAEIAEAFINARSAVNLRDLRFLSGRYGTESPNMWEQFMLDNTNLHHATELAPMMFDTPFWENLITPLKRKRSIRDYQQMYDLYIEEMKEGNNKQLYCIHISCKPGKSSTRPYMSGTLFVDAADYHLLAFDGQVEGIILDFNRTPSQQGFSIPLKLNFHLMYRHDHGFPEVASLSIQAIKDDFMTRTILFNIEDSIHLGGRERGVLARENMLTSIDKAGYDSILWTENEVVNRTEEEKRIIQDFVIREQNRKDSLLQVTHEKSPLKRLAERVRLFGQRIPQEKVFVHMDNTSYFLGDTVWFAAYTRRTDTDHPSRVSRVLYAELWNHDGFLVERKLVEMRDGHGSGFFELPDTLYGGFFELRAYTRWQLNWGQTEHPHSKSSELWFYNKTMAKEFFQDYEKLYSRVFPVYDKPQKPGEYVQDMTLRPLRRTFKDELPPSELRLSLFPEGGGLVAGQPCRVAFEAATEEGEAVEGKLVLKFPKTEEAIEAPTENRGRGTFVFTPERDKTYTALFSALDGRTAKQEMKAEAEGAVLQVCREDSLWRFDIRSTLPQRLGVTIMHEGKLQHFAEIDETGENLTEGMSLRIPARLLPTGVNQITVFDSIGHVYADRLFFVSRPNLQRPTLTITSLKEQYQPFEQIELGINGPQDTISFSSEDALPHISLSVRDAKHSQETFDSGNIMTEMLLASEIRGFVPQPEWYFQADDEEHSRALDLLMLTQGWRRFAWHDMALPGAWELSHPAELSQTVAGSVNRYSIDDPTSQRNNLSYMNWLTDADYILEEAEDPIYNTHFSSGSGDIGQKEFDDMRKRLNASPRRGFSAQRDAAHRPNGQGEMSKEVQIHAEFIKPDAPKNTRGSMVADMTTERKGHFKLELPRFYGDCIFFLTAKDTTLWSKKRRKLWQKKFRQHNWVHPIDDEWTRYREDAEFYVRLNITYPRWTKPYTYYQTTQRPFEMEGTDSTRLLRPGQDNTRLLNPVTIRSHRNRLRHLDLSKPALVRDAYEAANEAMDAGLLTDLYALKEPPPPCDTCPTLSSRGYQNTDEIAYAVALNTVGDMNMERRYDVSLFWDSTRVAGPDVIQPAFFSHDEQRHYSRLEYIDKVYLYTDYSPRNEGSQRYAQSDQPSVEVSLHRLPGNERRLTYRDRRYILHGFAYQEDFYHPDYQRSPPQEGQKDYRRTLYWNPDLRLNKNGQARVTFFNNSQTTRLHVEAEGQTPQGMLLYSP